MLWFRLVGKERVDLSQTELQILPLSLSFLYREMEFQQLQDQGGIRLKLFIKTFT